MTVIDEESLFGERAWSGTLQLRNLDEAALSFAWKNIPEFYLKL